MAVCLDCKWNPATQKFEAIKHYKCIQRNKGKGVKDCDCQHRLPRVESELVGNRDALHPGGDSSTPEGGEAHDHKLAEGSEPPLEGTEGQRDVESPGIKPQGLLGTGVLK